MIRTVIGPVIACCVTMACAEAERSPTSPSSSPSSQTAASTSTLSGIVYETTAEGPRPLPGAYLNALGGGGDSISAYADATGRYAFNKRVIGAAVIVQAVSIPGARIPRHQPCVATVVMQQDTVLDVEFNLAGVRGTGGPPFVSGTVFETTPLGRQPVQNRRVLYYVNNLLATGTFTDGEGRYEFCKVPLGAGRVWVTDPTDFELGNPVAVQAVTMTGSDLVVDLDIAK